MSWGDGPLCCEHLLPQIAKDVKQFYDQALQQAIVDDEANNAKAVVKTFHETVRREGAGAPWRGLRGAGVQGAWGTKGEGGLGCRLCPLDVISAWSGRGTRA